VDFRIRFTVESNHWTFYSIIENWIPTIYVYINIMYTYINIYIYILYTHHIYIYTIHIIYTHYIYKNIFNYAQHIHHPRAGMMINSIDWYFWDGQPSHFEFRRQLFWVCGKSRGGQFRPIDFFFSLSSLLRNIFLRLGLVEVVHSEVVDVGGRLCLLVCGCTMLKVLPCTVVTFNRTQKHQTFILPVS
jgi:hypothetical protein